MNICLTLFFEMNQQFKEDHVVTFYVSEKSFFSKKLIMDSNISVSMEFDQVLSEKFGSFQPEQLAEITEHEKGFH